MVGVVHGRGRFEVARVVLLVARVVLLVARVVLLIEPVLVVVGRWEILDVGTDVLVVAMVGGLLPGKL